MTASDRAFRALARSEPDVVGALLRVIAPASLVSAEALTREDVTSSQLDALPPPTDADWVARSRADELVHVECQGYRDPNFVERLFWYHLQLAIRHRPRHVRSIAIWLTAPRPYQRVDRHEHGDIIVRITTIVLAEVDASLLLAQPPTACFAPGADSGVWSDEELCQRTAEVMAKSGASYYQRHMAVVAAATRGRYEEMVKAMSDHNMEPVVIEDLVRFGEDRGVERGREGVLSTALEQKFGRTLTKGERSALRERIGALDDAELTRRVFSLDAAELAAWLADETSR